VPARLLVREAEGKPTRGDRGASSSPRSPGLCKQRAASVKDGRIAGAWQRAGRVSLSFARVIASLAGGGGSSDLAPSPRVDGLDVQAGPVDELLDVSVERPAVDQLEVKVGRTLEDRFLSALTGDHWEERHLDSVD
jgi:hypothetical protein